MDKQKSPFFPIIFFGALWGILEASLGHLLHYLPIGLSGLIMFPLACYLIKQLWAMNQNEADLWWMGLLAAGIKLVDLLIPGLPAIKTLNPAMALLMEALVVSLFISLIEKRGRSYIPAVFGLSFSWRILFILWGLLIDPISGGKVQLVHSIDSILRFVLINGVVNGAVLLLVFAPYKDLLQIPLHKLSRRPLGALAGLAAALGLQVIL